MSTFLPPYKVLEFTFLAEGVVRHAIAVTSLLVWRITASRKKAGVRTLCEGGLVFLRDFLDATVPFSCFITCPPVFLGSTAKYQIQGP